VLICIAKLFKSLDVRLAGVPVAALRDAGFSAISRRRSGSEAGSVLEAASLAPSARNVRPVLAACSASSGYGCTVPNVRASTAWAPHVSARTLLSTCAKRGGRRLGTRHARCWPAYVAMTVATPSAA
jgi:hypothetical protein